MAIDLESAQKIMKTNARSKGRLMVGSTHRFYKVNQTAKGIIDKGIIGTPNLIKIRMAHSGISTYWKPVTDWYYMKKMSGGGVLMDLGIDAVDLIRYFLGEIEEISTSILSLNDLIEVEDTAVSLMKIQNNVIGVIDVSWNSLHNDSLIEIFGDEGTIKIDYNYSFPLKLFTKEHKIMDLSGWHNAQIEIGNGYEEEIKYFINSLKQKRGFISNANDGYIALKVIDSMYEAAKKEKIIKL